MEEKREVRKQMFIMQSPPPALRPLNVCSFKKKIHGAFTYSIEFKEHIYFFIIKSERSKLSF